MCECLEGHYVWVGFPFLKVFGQDLWFFFGYVLIINFLLQQTTWKDTEQIAYVQWAKRLLKFKDSRKIIYITCPEKTKDFALCMAQTTKIFSFQNDR